MTNKITKVYKNGVAYDIYASGGAAGTGDVTGPSSSTDADIALFSGATGKIIKDSGKKLSDYQTALTTQTAYTTKGTATKVPTITTNTLGQVTGITETDISFPVTSVNSNTGAVTVNEVPSGGTDGQVLSKVSGNVAWANPESNVKIFTLSSTSDLVNAQSAYDWYAAGKVAILAYSESYYTVSNIGSGYIYFGSCFVNNSGNIINKGIRFGISNGTVTGITSHLRNIAVVSSLPSSPDNSIIYFVTN